MRKRHFGFLLLGVAVAMIYSTSQLLAGKLDTSTTLGKLENDLAQWSVIGAPSGSTSPVMAYLLAAVGAWLAFF
jgi:hypothetical protein